MEAVMGESDVPEQQYSFGIKKIVDCKIGEGGQQMYKVKWEATWEPAETLASCQHLIDEFWSFVNKAKENEELAQQHRKRMMLQQSTNNVMNIDQNFDRMSDDDKAEVQRLIARANATSLGGQMLRSPSNMLTTSLQHNQHSVPNPGQKSLNFNTPQQQQTFEADGGGQQQNLNSSGQKRKLGAFGNKGNAPTSPVKAESDDSTEQSDIKQNLSDGKGTGTASLKYLENFTSPYVKIIVVCKICNKEQSLKFSRYWREHFMTHSDTKPHKCPYCPKTFQKPSQMKKHAQSKHGNVMSAEQMNMAVSDDVKMEDYMY